MKISEMPYERLDLAAISERLQKAIADFQAAKTAEEQVKIYRDVTEQIADEQTMYALASIRFSLNTEDEFYEKENEFYDENLPILSAQLNAFQRTVLASPFLPELEKSLGSVVISTFRNSVKAMDEKIIPDLQEENAIVTEYEKLMSTAEVEFDGKKMTVPELGKYKMSPDREVRAKAYEVHGKFLESISETVDDIFDRLVKVRDRMAKKMGYENFVEMGYYRMNRIGYGKEDVQNFRDNVENHILPVVQKINERVKSELGIDQTMLYDFGVFVAGGNPRPEGSVEEIFAAGKQMYHEMGEVTGEFIDAMLEADAFDVIARKGKSGGGYCSYLPKYKQPFIFANFNGTSGDVDVLTHEAGHALAAYACRDLFVDDQEYGMETAETHSMSMEFFAHRWLDLFYGDKAETARYCHLVDALYFLPYGVIVDAFQHIVYENPEMTPAERKEAYLALEKKYRPFLSMEGMTYFDKGTRWQYQSHIFGSPFYYIDYCLAQSVALQFYLASREDFDDAFNRYFAFLKKGGTKPFATLVKEAGMKNPLESGSLADIGVKVEKILF